MASSEKPKRRPKPPRKAPGRKAAPARPRARTAQEKSARPLASATKAGPPRGSLGRTRRLLLAALRLWELKQGGSG